MFDDVIYFQYTQNQSEYNAINIIYDVLGFHYAVTEMNYHMCSSLKYSILPHTLHFVFDLIISVVFPKDIRHKVILKDISVVNRSHRVHGWFHKTESSVMPTISDYGKNGSHPLSSIKPIFFYRFRI